MRKIIVLAALSAVLIGAAAPKNEIDFPGYVNGRGAASSIQDDDQVAVVRGTKTLRLPGNKIVTPDSTNTMTRKTFDYNQNTFVNFPFSTGPYIPPTSCAGLPDGALYNNNGVLTICGASALNSVALNSGGDLLLNSGDFLALNN